MINFQVIRTSRLTVQLQELTIKDSLEIASMPIESEQAVATSFLNKAVLSVTGVTDIDEWTVSERMLVICQYLSATIDTDNPDFEVGDGFYSDYLDGGNDIDLPIKAIEVGLLNGDNWKITHLTGKMIEAIERLKVEFKEIKGVLFWNIGAMAAQLTRENDIITDSKEEGAYDEWLLNRINVFLNFPESDFETLLINFNIANDKLQHLISYGFDEYGVVALSKEGRDIEPARFRAYKCLSNLAVTMG